MNENEKKYRYEINEGYEYNEPQLHKFHDNLELIQQHYKRVEIVRINLYKIKHDGKVIDLLFNCLNSNRKFADNLIYYCYCLEYKPVTGEHYHFAFFFNPDTKFESRNKRAAHSMRPSTPAWFLREKMREFFDRQGLTEVDISIVNPESERVKKLKRLGVGIWTTNATKDDELASIEPLNEGTEREKIITIDSVSFVIGYLFKTVKIKDGFNQKENVFSRRKISSCKVRLPVDADKIVA